MSRARSRAKNAEPKKVKQKEVRGEIASVIEQINKNHGEGSIKMARKMIPFNHIETGVFVLDFALLGGFPEGLAGMLTGWESSGKTTLILRTVANLQKKHPDKLVVWVDTEKTLDPMWAEKHGVDLDRLVISDPATGEDAVDVIDAVMSSEEVCAVVLDSVPATVPFAISDKSASDATMAELARLMGKLSSKIVISWAKERKRGHWVSVFFTNQFRSSMSMFGDPRALTGGKQINYLVTTRIDLKNKEEEGKDEFDIPVVERNVHTFKITKAKVGVSLRNGEFSMVVNPSNPLGQGAIDEVQTVRAFARKMGFIKGGSSKWYFVGIGCDEVFPKIEPMERFLEENPDIALRLKQAMIATQRVSKGLPALPPDGWLLGEVDKKMIEGALDVAKNT